MAWKQTRVRQHKVLEGMPNFCTLREGNGPKGIYVMGSLMANFIHQLDWIMGCSDNWSNIFLGVFWMILTFESID